MGGYNIIVEADDAADDLMAADIGRALCEAYPGHQWHVRIGKGLLIIKHMQLSYKVGIARRYQRMTWDANARKREAIMAAGEYLERAGLTRGKAREGDVVQAVEGIDHKNLLPESMRAMR